VVAIILGHLSLSEIKNSAGRLGGQGLAIAGLVLGYAGVAFIPLILIIAAIAIPNLRNAHMAANEASALANIRTLVIVETSYSGNHTATGFTCSLSHLVQDQLISTQLASGNHMGYNFELSNCTPTTDGGPNIKFQVVAYPQIADRTGKRAFCSDESGVVKVDSSGSAQACLENGKPLSE